MSRYVVLIAAYTAPNTSAHQAITVTSNPKDGVALLQNYSPLKLALLHAIPSGHLTDSLERILHIKFKHRLLHNFWFDLSVDDILFIREINELNLNKFVRETTKALAPPVAPLAPPIAIEALPDFISEQLANCERLLK